MIIDFLSAIFNHFYDIMVNDQGNTKLSVVDVLKKEDVIGVSGDTRYVVRFESEPIVLGDSSNSFIEHSEASDSDKSGAICETPPVLADNDDFAAPNLIKNTTIFDFILDDTSMHEIALFVHYLQYSF